jgi:hypothetical protein
MPDKKIWIILTSDDRPIADIVKDLRQAGFEVRDVLDEIGSVTGRADPRIIDKLRAIPGVIDVSPDVDIDIGPPDAPIS